MKLKTILLALGLSQSLAIPKISASNTITTTSVRQTEIRTQPQEPAKNPQANINLNLTGRVGYEFHTRTSDKKGSERPKNILIHTAKAGIDYKVRDVTFSLNAALAREERSEESNNQAIEITGYRSKSVTPAIRFANRDIDLRLSALYATVGSHTFELEGKRERIIGASLDGIFGTDLQLRASLAGITDINQTREQTAVYVGLGSRVSADLYGDVGVTHDRNNFYDQTATYGILGLQSTGRTRIRGELSAGEKFGTRLSLETPLTNNLSLSFGASASRIDSNNRIVDDVAVGISLIGRN